MSSEPGAGHIAKRLGKKNVGDLERLATAAYVNCKYGKNLPVEKRAAILTSLKPHVSVELARAAFGEAQAIEQEAHIYIAA